MLQGDDASAYAFIEEFGGGVDISPEGPGTGSNGGFATAQNYLHFHSLFGEAGILVHDSAHSLR